MATALVIDDDPTVSRTLRDALSRWNVSVVAAFGVQQALDLLLTTPYDAIVLDLVLGHRSGFDVIDAMHHDDIKTPIIVVGASIPDYARILLQPPQVFTILKKPFDHEIMIAAILGLCGIDPEKTPPPEDFTTIRPRVP